MSKLTQSFNDGVVNIYTVGNIASSGDMPQEGLTLKVGPLRYEERTVGMGRYWTAMQKDVQIDIIVRTQRISSVSSQDVAVLIDGKQYEIKQAQYPPDIEPPVMDLSLERLVQNYDIAGIP